ncbi:hypothetical protein DICSQDRAFT_156884 [Dichomitus squalens LYAD-421 SS1]|uniref:Uncharacterized protein n=1 Tax=Dichomitus squalens (strain LYAD-421) TaxID=732165 RepID=R7SQ60_DICSQ|nr:uncharacterized protein DICSQDRAFT_156884 [Dichomitus squalens LYAD-421 SS1]EJF58324.1 hypothetical protein DICSQDRAFT_156884 [Dichomitus squalens LYAD-421 SS1]
MTGDNGPVHDDQREAGRDEGTRWSNPSENRILLSLNSRTASVNGSSQKPGPSRWERRRALRQPQGIPILGPRVQDPTK